MIQIRITEPDGSNAVILDAMDRKIFETLNSPDEGITFKVAKNHEKSEVLNPDNGGYTRFWEAWDTVTNERINHGAIVQIEEDGPNWSITGTGRVNFLNDYIDTRKTFYAAIDDFVDSLRFENISIEPRTSTLVHNASPSAAQTTVFGNITVNEKYFGLSKNTKDNVIDNQAQARPGEMETPNTYYSVDSFWAGQSRSDSLIVDLGDVFPIARINVSMPWWGGIARRQNRSFDFTLSYADDVETPITTLRDRDFGPFHELYDTGNNSKKMGFFRYYLGTNYQGSAVDTSSIHYVGLDQPGPIDMRYIRLNISDTHAWDGGYTTDDPVTEGWARQCDPNYAGGVSEGIEINDRTLKPNNDCYASIVEISAYKEVVGKDTVKPLALQRIDNDNMQITYYHIPDASETTTTDNGYRAFEPGGFFRKFEVSYSNANNTYTKFFDSDCANCYPDGFSFGIVDQNNSLIHSSDNSSGTPSVKGPVYTRSITMRGASNAVVTYVDAWKSKEDQLSWGASYSFTEQIGDYATVQFKGESFKWYASIPEDKTGAEVEIKIRNKTGSGSWTSYTTLESAYQLPNNIYSTVVYEITYESGTLSPDTVYEIRITNLDGGFCSIDSFEGYWSASMTTYNDDSSRVFQSRPEKLEQIYDGRFNNGTMMKWNQPSFLQFTFEGDRIIILSAKGRRHGIATLFLFETPEQGDSVQSEYSPEAFAVSIPGGNPDGSLSVDLGTGKRGQEIPQYILFDSNDYFPTGLPWSRYHARVSLQEEDVEVYSANIYDTNNFVNRCEDCKTPKGVQDINKYIYLDSFIAHEKVGLSVSFEDQTHLEMLRDVAEAIQTEWDVTEQGVVFSPRIGTDTNEILREGQNTVVDYKIVNDISKVASMLFSSGADIDGLPLTTVVEDRKNRETLGRTIMRKEDFRSLASYQQMIGLGRTELKKRRYPEKRITVSHISDTFSLNKGDSFTLYTKKMGPLRVRIIRKETSETNSGRIYDLECIRWPIIS